MQISNTIIDNSENLRLVDTLKNILTTQDINKIDIATGYWDIPGLALLTNELRQFLQKEGNTLRLLIGKDPLLMARYNENPKYKGAKYPKDYLKIDINEIEVTTEYKAAVQLLLTYCATDKLQIRLYKGEDKKEVKFLHAKCYILYKKHDIENKQRGSAYGIIGSSNFTEKGLEGNAELNYLETEYSKIIYDGDEYTKSHLSWFTQRWEEGEEWNKEFLEEVLTPSKIARAVIKANVLTAYEAYIKLLQDKYDIVLDSAFSALLKSYLPSTITPFEYQLNAVQQCYSYLIEHGGCILGDAVGLGKTVVGVLLIRHYIETYRKLGKGENVLILAPKAVISLWKDMIKKFDTVRGSDIEKRVSFLTPGKLDSLFSKTEEREDEEETGDEIEDSVEEVTLGLTLTEDKEEDGELKESKGVSYGLIVIDESHNFRRSSTDRYQALNQYIERINTQEGYYPYITLISATLQNNYPNDIKNQLYLFEREPKHSTLKRLPAGNLEAFFSKVNKEYNEIIHSKRESGNKDELKDRMIKLARKVREGVLEDLLVRRTRADIKKHYNNEVKCINVHGPTAIEYKMSSPLARLFFDTTNIITGDRKFTEEGSNEYLGYYRYRATAFLNKEYETRYKGKNMDPAKYSALLAGLMQELLVKRLESSFDAFKVSLDNLYKYTNNMLKMWEKDSIFICPSLNINAELDIEKKQERRPDKVITIEDCFNDIREKIKRLDKKGQNSKGQNAEYKRKDFKVMEGGKTYIDYIKEDLSKIKRLKENWEQNKEDPKFDKFIEVLKEDGGILFDKKNESKKLVIFSEAIPTIKMLERAIKKETNKRALVITAQNREAMESVIKENFDANYKEQKDDFDVIITSEVLAEGVNLHRASFILNYDIPWNATRLIQRIGRVNRIGSAFNDIYVFNFYPSKEGDSKINLTQNAFTKLQSFHTMFGEDNKVFSEEEELFSADFEKSIDEEESPQEKFIAELREYKAKYPKRYDEIKNKTLGENKVISHILKEDAGVSYFVIKENKNDAGVYIRMDKDKSCKVISSVEFFTACHCSEDTKEVIGGQDIEGIKTLAIKSYIQNKNKILLQKAFNKNTNSVLEEASKIIRSEALGAEERRIIGKVIKVIKEGNIALVKQLEEVLEAINKVESKEELGFNKGEQVQQIVKTAFSNIDNIGKNKESKDNNAYVYGSFLLQ